jgi:hypothetical protein
MNSKLLILVFFVIAGLIYYSRNSSDVPSTTQIESNESTETIEPTISTISTTSTTSTVPILENQPEIDLPPSTTVTITSSTNLKPMASPQKIEKKEASEAAAEFFRRTNQLIPIVGEGSTMRREEFRKLVPYTGPFSPEEKLFNGVFQAKNSDLKQTIRLNLSYRRRTESLGREVCFSVRDDVTNRLLALDNDQTIRVLRTSEPGYLVIMGQSHTMLQLLITDDDGSLTGFLKYPAESKKYVLRLEEKPGGSRGLRLNCKDFW